MDDDSIDDFAEAVYEDDLLSPDADEEPWPLAPAFPPLPLANARRANLLLLLALAVVVTLLALVPWLLSLFR